MIAFAHIQRGIISQQFCMEGSQQKVIKRQRASCGNLLTVDPVAEQCSRVDWPLEVSSSPIFEQYTYDAAFHHIFLFSTCYTQIIIHISSLKIHLLVYLVYFWILNTIPHFWAKINILESTSGYYNMCFNLIWPTIRKSYLRDFFHGVSGNNTKITVSITHGLAKAGKLCS